MKIKGAFLFECTLKCLSDDFAYTVPATPGVKAKSTHITWILKLNMTMWKYASPVVRMFLSIHAKFVDNALYKARRALGE